MGRRKRKLDWANDRILSEFADYHPARRFLVAFLELRREVVGRDIVWPDRPEIDQKWESKLFRRKYSFASIAYTFISYTLTMDEWFDDQYTTVLSDYETGRIAIAPMLKTLLSECEAAGRQDGNDPILGFVNQTREMIDLGLEASGYRVGMTNFELLEQWGQDPQLAADAYLKSN